MALPEVVSSEEWLKARLGLLALVERSSCATALTELGAPRHAETTRSGDIPNAHPSERHVAGSWRSPWKTASTLFPSGSMTNAA